MDTLRWRVGDATVLGIAEFDAAAALQGLIPKFDLADVARAEWLTPYFVDQDGLLRGLVQAFVIMIADQVIIIDPCVGNGKNRSAVPGWGNLHTDFLDRLRAAGVALDIVNYVVNTHLHSITSVGTPRLSMELGNPPFPRPATSCLVRSFAIGSPGLRRRSRINTLVSPTRCCRCTRRA
jgi:hypothetical protein